MAEKGIPAEPPSGSVQEQGAADASSGFSSL
jgi:hypothetical protein